MRILLILVSTAALMKPLAIDWEASEIRRIEEQSIQIQAMESIRKEHQREHTRKSKPKAKDSRPKTRVRK